MIVLGYGLGTDSTAILCGWYEKGYQAVVPIEKILFADTGGERPHSYAYLEKINAWLIERDFPPVTVVKKGGRQETLEENSLRKNTLPSLAFGRKKCSHVFKIEPQERYLNRSPDAKRWWGKRRGQPVARKITKLIGYEYEERHRWMKAMLEDDHYFYKFPLVEWEWSRPECEAAILRNGLPLPGKSACFFCPASTKPEIAALKKEYPVLFHRAIAMEDNAAPNLKSIKGLGRRFSRRDYATTLEEPDVVPCMACVDGS